MSARWGQLMAAALRLGVQPEAFWRMSLREWRLILDGLEAAPAMSRAELEKLAREHPDGGER